MTPTSRIKALRKDALHLEKAIARHEKHGYDQLADKLRQCLEHVHLLIAYDKDKEGRNENS